MAHFGLEHHESNDSRLAERALLMPTSGDSLGGLLAHFPVYRTYGCDGALSAADRAVVFAGHDAVRAKRVA